MNKEEYLKSEVTDLTGQTSFGKLKKFRNFYFAGRPTNTESFKEIKEKYGITKVIDFKGPGESGFDDKELAEEAGLTYVNVPIAGCHTVSKDLVREVNSEIDDNEPTLIYCMSANRANSWFAAHLYLEHNFTVEEAMEKAQETGMDKPGMIMGTTQLLQSY